MSRSRMYSRFCSMHARCYDSENSHYHRYGGRGIYVCEKWHVFDNYYSDLGDIPRGLSVDRIDNDGPYAPENCRVATATQQARNKSNNHIIYLDGESKTMAEWAEITGLPRTSIRNRLQRGWSAEEALTTPISGPGYRFRDGSVCGYRGVYFNQGKWQARIRLNGRRRHIGTYLTAEDAHRAYLAAESRHFAGAI